ncbi:MAG TPA: haloacid dehalogenase type II [Rhodothermales bacterium]|nr:haloacid dehalogenase type II [Rhodothermales bacterium]
MPVDFEGVQYLTFDCYGTLIDWERGILDAMSPILNRHGHSIDDGTLLERYAVFEAEIEAGEFSPYCEVLRGVVDRFGGWLGFLPSEEDRASFSASASDWPAFPDSRDALARLARRFRLVVLSNVDDDLFEGSNDRLGRPFYAVFTAGQIGSYKPDLRNFRYMIERLGGDPRPIVHVAQSLFHDIAPAREMGFQTVWVNRRRGMGGAGATPPAEARPNLEVASLEELVEFMEERSPTGGEG